MVLPLLLLFLFLFLFLSVSLPPSHFCVRKELITFCKRIRKFCESVYSFKLDRERERDAIFKIIIIMLIMDGKVDVQQVPLD